jgi:hypothetical protein
VQLFKSRCLTYSDDALPALSGIAQRTLALDPGQYFAGIWEKGIANQLGFFGEMPRVMATDVKMAEHALRSRPTFTWATFPGPIEFDGQYGEPICTLLEGQVQPVASDLFGQVKGGFIRLQGYSLQGPEMARKLLSTKLATPAMVHLDGVRAFPASRYPPHAQDNWYEGLDAIWDWSVVVCFGLTESWTSVGDWRNRHYITMLLLQPSHEKDSFVRIGLVTHFPVDWYDELACESVVTIV